MPFGTRDNSKLDAFSKVLRSTAGALLEGEVKRAEISRKQRDEAGVAQELDAYRNALTGASDPMTIANVTLQTSAKLNGYGPAGIGAANQVLKASDLLLRIPRPPVVKPQTRIEKGDLQKHGNKYGRPVTTLEGTVPIKYDWVEEGGELAGGGGGWGAVEQRKLDALIAQKEGLYSRIKSNPANRRDGKFSVDLKAILRGEADVPMTGGKEERRVAVDESGMPILIPDPTDPDKTKIKMETVKIGQVPDPDIMKWRDVMRQSEVLSELRYKAKGIPYVPGETLALEEKYGKQYANASAFTAAFRGWVKKKTGVDRDPTAAELKKAKGKYYP